MTARSRKSCRNTDEKTILPLRINGVEVINQGVLRRLTVSFGQLNELYGAPASGKTTLLKTLSNVIANIQNYGESNYSSIPNVCHRLNHTVSYGAVDPALVSVTVSTNLGNLTAQHKNGREWLEAEEVAWSGKRAHLFPRTMSWFIDLTAKDFYNINRGDLYRSAPTYPYEDPRSSSHFGWGDVRTYREALNTLLEEVFQQSVQVMGTSKHSGTINIQLSGEQGARYSDMLRFGLLRVAGTLSYLLDEQRFGYTPNVVFLDHADLGLTRAEFTRYASVLTKWAENRSSVTQVFIAHGLGQPVVRGAHRLHFDVHQDHYARISENSAEVLHEEGPMSPRDVESDLRTWGEAEGARLPRAGWPWDRRVVKSNA